MSERPSVLIVEDERIVAMDLQMMLEEMGYDAYAVASSADEAFAVVHERKPDLALMDIRIDGPKDGIETGTVLHERYNIPVVFLSAHSDPATIDRAKNCDPFGYLVKPVNQAELRTAVEVALHKHAKVGKEIQRLNMVIDSLQHRSSTDELTGLLNRRGLAERATRAIEQANRSLRPIAFAYFDLNGMKKINDTQGHAMGDRALIAMGKLLNDTFRSSDLVSRLGGDEFLAVSVEYLEADEGKTIVERFRRNLGIARARSTDPFELSASIGVVIYDPTHPRSFEELVAEADATMYRAKTRRRIDGTQSIPLSR